MAGDDDAVAETQKKKKPQHPKATQAAAKDATNRRGRAASTKSAGKLQHSFERQSRTVLLDSAVSFKDARRIGDAIWNLER